MQLPEQAGAVTPQGVRAGDPAALAALCVRRGGAVLAYAREVCAPADAPLAAAEALARFRAAVAAAGDASGLDPEALLLGATRHAAAACARRPSEPGTTRRILGRAHTEVCAQVPALIVARAENLLGDADLDRLGRHLDRCSTCRETEARFRRAERAYVGSAHAPLDSATTALFLGALAEAAPIEELPEPEPEPESEPEPAPTPESELIAALDAAGQERIPDEFDDLDEDGWVGEPAVLTDPEATADPALEPEPIHWDVPDPPRRRRRLRIVLPVAVVAGAVAALGVAGVFDGGSGKTGTVDTRTVRSTSVAPARTTSAEQARRARARRRAAARRRRSGANPTAVTVAP